MIYHNLYFLIISFSIFSLLGCLGDSEPLKTILIPGIPLPSKATKKYIVSYTVPKDGLLSLYIKAEKTNVINVPPIIKQKCKKLSQKTTLANLKGFKYFDRKNYDQKGQLTFRGQILVKQARKHAIKSCVNKFIFANIDININNNGENIFTKKDISKDHSVTQKSTYYLIQLNGHFGFVKKNDKLKIEFISSVFEEKPHITPPISYQLISILSER